MLEYETIFSTFSLLSIAFSLDQVLLAFALNQVVLRRDLVLDHGEAEDEEDAPGLHLHGAFGCFLQMITSS